MITINEYVITPTIFPDKTSQVWKLPDWLLKKSEVNIVWDFDHEGEIMHLAQLKILLSEHNIKARLYLSYLPYGRQDKAVDNNATFALLPFAMIINFLGFVSVDILDPHSSNAEHWIRNSHALYPGGVLQRYADDIAADLYCFPDEGARVKYKHCYTDRESIYGEKERDQATGHILNYKLIGDPFGQNVLIVDDICDGGMTFILLAQELLDAGAASVNLFVTHGIFSKGLGPLKDAGIGRIFTAKGEAVEIDKLTVGYKS